MISSRHFLSLLSVLCVVNELLALSVADRTQLARSRLHEALSSPSGKLTLSPEVVIHEPADLTAILLQSNAIQIVSNGIRNAKANAAYIHGSVTALQTFVSEQETARGNFPGPIPVVYCGECDEKTLRELSEAGAAGVLVTMQLDTLSDHAHFCKRAIDCGVQPIPEVILSTETAKSWTQADVTSLVESLSKSLDMEPVSVLLTVAGVPSDDEGTDDDDVTLPPVSKELSKKIPILGSVRVAAGKNRIGAQTAILKEAGYTGSVLRAGCIPVARSADLEAVGRFWEACISDLKSTRSKSFSFRSKNRMEKNAAVEWLNYSKDVADSGALGDFSGNLDDVNADGGDYKGF